MQRLGACGQQFGDEHVHRKKLNDERNIAVDLDVGRAEHAQNRVLGKAHHAHDGAEHHGGENGQNGHADRIEDAVEEREPNRFSRIEGKHRLADFEIGRALQKIKPATDAALGKVARHVVRQKPNKRDQGRQNHQLHAPLTPPSRALALPIGLVAALLFVMHFSV